MHFISFYYIFFSLSTHSIELALASFVCLPTAAAAADQLVVCYFFISFSLVSCVCVCGEGISFFICVYIFALIRPAIAVPDGRVFSLGLLCA